MTKQNAASRTAGKHRFPGGRMLFGKENGTRRQRRIKLLTQIMVCFTALMLLNTLLSGVLDITLVRNQVQGTSLDSLLEHARDISELVLRPGRTLKVINAQQLDEWERLTDARVILVDTDMTVITKQSVRTRKLNFADADDTPLSADKTETDLLSTIDYALVSGVMSGKTVADVRQFDFMGGTWLFAGVPIRSGDEITGIVLLCQPLSYVDDVSRNQTLIMLLAVTASMIIALAVALALTNRITHPVSVMTRAAMRMASGDYGENVSIAGTQEIAQLGESLNHLSANLDTSIRSLNEEKAKMELVLSGIGEGLIALSPAGSIVHCNDIAMRLLELTTDDLAIPAPELAERSQMLAMLRQSLATGEDLNGGWKNGQGVSVAASVSPIRTANGIMGAVGLVRDVSEAERLEQLRRDYVANISHELRTPLTGIRGMVEPLIDGVYETEPEKQECYQIIYQETRRLERLISDMLDMSRLQDGRITIELEPMPIMSLLNALVWRMEKQADDAGINLRIDPASEVMVMANEDRIMQVLIILVDNAIKFTPKFGSITLHTRQADDMLWVSVRDTGEGISKEDLPYIFERFYKADKSRMATKGTGLGLAIARLVVELMGGTIWCESEKGKGTTFEFSLRIAPEQQLPDESHVVMPVRAAKTNPLSGMPETRRVERIMRETAESVGMDPDNVEFDKLINALFNDSGKK